MWLPEDPGQGLAAAQLGTGQTTWQVFGHTNLGNMMFKLLADGAILGSGISVDIRLGTRNTGNLSWRKLAIIDVLGLRPTRNGWGI